tara:strand:- start:856 stop:1335 length:480 start_codon:yes stop_codon:yes gene_type:complete
MTFNIQVVLEHKNDVIRNIEIPSKKTLEDLHYAIIESLKLNKNEIASFYITNKNLDLLNEIPLFKIDEKTNFTMSKIKIETIFENIDTQLLYIYDFLHMWRFSVSLISKKENTSNTSIVTNSIGKMPKEAPEIIFQSNHKNHFHEEDLNIEFNEFNESE